MVFPLKHFERRVYCRKKPAIALQVTGVGLRFRLLLVENPQAIRVVTQSSEPTKPQIEPGGDQACFCAE